MAKKHKISGKTISVPVGIAIGVLVCVAALLMGALLLAYLVVNENVGVNGIGVGAMLIVVLSSALGALSGSVLVKQKSLLVTGLTAMVFYLVLLSITAVFFDGLYSSMALTALMVLVGVGGSLLTRLHKKSRKSKIKIPAYR